MNIQRELIKLKSMPVSDLCTKYHEVFGEGTRSRNKDFLIKRIAWRMQANVYGGVSERALKRAKELANEADIRIRAPANFTDEPSKQKKVKSVKKDPRLPKPGTVLNRQYKGKEIIVTVLDDGFEYDDKKYRSLSAIAKEVTGSHWNGFLFFGLK